MSLTLQEKGITVDDAREKIKMKTPAGYQIVSTDIIASGERTVSGSGETTDLAFFNVLEKIGQKSVLQRRVIVDSKEETLIVEAYDEKEAIGKNSFSQLGYAGPPVVVRNTKLAVKGRRGFLGIGKKPNQYMIDIFRHAVVEITYSTGEAEVRSTLLSPDELALRDKQRQEDEEYERNIEKRMAWEGIQNDEAYQNKTFD